MLIDPRTGKPLVPSPALAEPIATPEERPLPIARDGRRTPLPDPMGQLNPRRVAAILRAADEGDPSALLGAAEQVEDVFWYYRLELAKRRRVVAGQELAVEAAADDARSIAAADLVRDLVASGMLASVRYDLMDAVSKGFSVSEISWHQTAERWWPTSIAWRSQRWFRFASDGRLQLISQSGPVDLAPARFIWCALGDRSGSPIMGGLIRPALLLWLYTSYTLSDWAEFLEAFGRPNVLGRFPASASPQQQEQLMRAVQTIATGGRAIMPEGMSIDINWGTARSTDGYERRADWLHRQISLLVLGQNLTTSVTSGSFAASKTHDTVRLDIAHADACVVDAALQNQLVRPLVDFNLGPPPDGRYPRLYTRWPDQVDMAALVGAVVPLVDRGMTIGVSTLRDRLGLPDPGEDAVLQPLRQQGDSGGAADPKPAAAPHSIARHAREQQERALIDDLVEEALSGEVALDTLEPVLAALRDAITAAEDADSLEAALSDALPQLDMTAFAEDLVKRMFLARLAARAKHQLPQ